MLKNLEIRVFQQKSSSSISSNNNNNNNNKKKGGGGVLDKLSRRRRNLLCRIGRKTADRDHEVGVAVLCTWRERVSKRKLPPGALNENRELETAKSIDDRLTFVQKNKESRLPIPCGQELSSEPDRPSDIRTEEALKRETNFDTH